MQLFLLKGGGPLLHAPCTKVFAMCFSGPIWDIDLKIFVQTHEILLRAYLEKNYDPRARARAGWARTSCFENDKKVLESPETSRKLKKKIQKFFYPYNRKNLKNFQKFFFEKNESCLESPKLSRKLKISKKKISSYNRKKTFFKNFLKVV